MVLFDAGSAPSMSSSKPFTAAAAAGDRFEHDSRGRTVSRLVIRNIAHSHAGVYTCQPASADAVDVTVHVLNGTVLAVATDGERFLLFFLLDHSLQSLFFNFSSGVSLPVQNRYELSRIVVEEDIVTKWPRGKGSSRREVNVQKVSTKSGKSRGRINPKRGMDGWIMIHDVMRMT